MTYWLVVGSLQNWKKGIRNNVWGFTNRWAKKAKKIKKGDKIIGYISKLGVFCIVCDVTSNYFYDESRIWKDKIYPHRFRFKPHFYKPLDVKRIVDKLSFLKHKKWGAYLQIPIRKLNKQDFTVILNRLSKTSIKKLDFQAFISKKLVSSLSYKFHKKIETLMDKLGFDIILSNPTGPGPDLIVESENNRILIQCKKAEKRGKTFPGIQKLIDEYARKVQKLEADVAILAISGYKIREDHLKEERQEEILKNDRVAIWDDRKINYYNKLSNILKKWARYHVFVDLGINKVIGPPIEVPAILIKQGKYSLYFFALSPQELLKISYVLRKETYKIKGFQRMLNPRRLNPNIEDSIPTFINSDDFVFPTNIVCLLSEKINFDGKKISIPCRYGAIQIIDGQHRLYGFCFVDEKRRKSTQLLCVGLEKNKVSEAERGRIFLDINYKARKVSTLLLLSLYQLTGTKDLRVDIVRKLSETKQFKNKVKLGPGQTGKISLVTFSLTPPMKTLVLGRNALLRRIYTGPDEKFEDYCFEVLKEYFRIIANELKEKWYNSEKYILSTNRGIRALLRLLIHIIKNTKWKFDKEKTREFIRVLEEMELENERLRGRYLGEDGAREFCSNMCKIIKDKFPEFEFEEVKIVDQCSINVGERDEAEKFLKKWLSKLQGEIVAFLSYIDETTFDYLKWIKNSKEFKLIVGEIRNSEKCLKKIKELEKFDKKVEIKRYRIIKEEGKYGAIHKRWVSGKSYLIDVGIDLKKQSLGNREHTIRVYSNVKQLTDYKRFKELWKGIERIRKPVIIEPFYPLSK